MKILAINASYRREGTTTRLTEAALAGAAAEGADTEMILLTRKDIRYCTNCLTCYKDLTSPIAPCPLDDDVRGILEKIRDADGVLFTSPVHAGFVTALMAAFMERAAWPLSRPTGKLLGQGGCPEPRLTEKARAVATIVSAGCVLPENRQYCDLATPWLADAAMGICNGESVGDVYAAACFPREMTDEDWQRAFLLRELTDEQLAEARALGVKVARAVAAGTVRPYDPMRSLQSMQQAKE